MHASGCHVYLESLRAVDPGVYVVRALVPELVPFHIGYGHERFGHPRIAGLGARGPRTLLPHPFW